MEEKENTNPFQYINEEEKLTKEEPKDEEKLKEAFVTGLPDWDLTPPYDVIRRVNRK